MRKRQKGMTVVEVVVSFTLVTLSFAMGMAGIACGAGLINSGARMKHTRSELQKNITVSGTQDPAAVVVVQDSDSGASINVVATEYSLDGFQRYATVTTPIGGGP